MADAKLSALTLTPGAQADFIYGEQAGTSYKFTGLPFLNALDFNTVGHPVDPTGVADSTAGLQVALTASANRTLFIPGGTYKVSSPLNFTAHTTTANICGAGKDNTVISGSVTGFILNAPNTPGTFHNFNSIYDLSIANTNLAAGNGCIKAPYIDNLATIRDCSFQGFIGVDIGSTAADAGSFGCSVINCHFTSGLTPVTADQSANGYAFTTGSVGIFLGQGAMINCRLTNFHETICCSETGGQILGCSVEVSDNALTLGKRSDGTWAATSWLVSGFQTERCVVGCVVLSASACTIQNSTFTGQTAPPISAAINNATWSGATNKVTVTTTLNHNLVAGTHNLYLEFSGSGSGSGFLLNGNINACTVTGATTFTYPLSSNPGTFSAGAGNDWNYTNSTGLVIAEATDCVFASSAITLSTSNAGVDLNNPFLSANATNCTMMNIQSGSGWIAPPAAQKSAWTFINCGDMTNTGNFQGPAGNFSMNFADLPGQTGVKMKNAYEGMEFNIVDGNTNPIGNFGATQTGTGGAGFHCKVRYNGTAWTICGG